MGAGQGFYWLLYPFMTGRDGYEVALSDAHWIHLGKSLRAIHSVVLPTKLVELLPQEMYSPHWRDFVCATDAALETQGYADPIAQELTQFWLTQRGEIRHLVDRAEQLAEVSKTRQLPYVLCHTDLHAGNVLLGADGELPIVDWDNPILAPKERDLMFAGGGQFGMDRSEAEEEDLFYQGYGPVEVDQVALAYYRYERIVADIAAYAEQIFGLLGSVEDRRQGFQQLASQLQPNGVIPITHRAYSSNLTNQPRRPAAEKAALAKSSPRE